MNKLLFIAALLSTTSAQAQQFTLIETSQQSLSTTSRDVYIKGVIDQRMAFDIERRLNDLNASSNAEIVVHITSPGGSVYAGLEILDAMLEGASPIHTVCEGYCMSMAATLLASGDVRESTENASIMFHQLSTKTQGKIDEIKADLVDADRLQLLMDKQISVRSGMTINDVKKMESYDHFMSPEEAKKLNLIDKIRGKHGK